MLLESAVNGASGVIAVRSSSGIGLSVINVEFDWGVNVYTARQVVQERLATVLDRLPPGVRPHMGPIASLLGQIVLVGVWSENGTTSPMELRTIADWVIRQRLLTIKGVAQVITIGGGRKQYHVLVDQHKMHQYEVSLPDVETALSESNLNVTGGFMSRDSRDFLIRGLGRFESVDQIKHAVVKRNGGRSVLVEQVASVVEAPQTKRGDSSINGQSAVVLTIQKQPQADTRAVTQRIEQALDELKSSLPDDVVVQSTYEQREFIDHSVQKCCRGAARWSHPGRNRTLRLSVELSHDLHHADGNSAIDSGNRDRISLVRPIDQRHDAGRVGRGTRRTGRRRDRGCGKHLSPLEAKPAAGRSASGSGGCI